MKNKTLAGADMNEKLILSDADKLEVNIGCHILKDHHGSLQGSNTKDLPGSVQGFNLRPSWSNTGTNN